MNHQVYFSNRDFSFFNNHALEEWKYQTWTFSAGEVGVRLEDVELTTKKVMNGLSHWHVSIVANITDSESLMELVMLDNAIKNYFANLNLAYTQQLYIPYMPYGRQDRVAEQGESNSIVAFSNIINGLNHDSVYTLDPHSDVMLAVINGCTAIPQKSVVEHFINDKESSKILSEVDCVVSPDGGALKKIYQSSPLFEQDLHVVTANKHRNTKTGEVEFIQLNDIKLNALKHFLLIDDICDGGRTFIECAKQIRKYNKAAYISLIVSHGIFSKGTKKLFDHFDYIFTTDSFQQTDKRLFVASCQKLR